MPRGLLAAARRAARLGEFGPFFVGGAGLPGAWSHSPDTLLVSLISAGRAPMTMIRSTHIRLLVLFAMVALGVVLVAGQQPQAPPGGRGAAAPAASGAAPQGRGGRGQPAGRTGITVDGEVKNYVPVTDTMLRNPDPSDWLIVRRTYNAWNHSPLNQITRDNVHDLRMQWVWAMNECGASGRNQPTPIVHNGIMYLLNCGHVLQALDARTGELIWEHNLGIPST